MSKENAQKPGFGNDHKKAKSKINHHESALNVA